MTEEAIKKSTRYYPEETEEYWNQHRSGFLASGVSRRMYCQANGVNCDRFNYWFKKLSSHGDERPLALCALDRDSILAISGAKKSESLA